MAKIIDGGWLNVAEQEEQNITIGTFSNEQEKENAQTELDERLKEIDQDS